jgi:outer membrane beta-barrel protein
MLLPSAALAQKKPPAKPPAAGGGAAAGGAAAGGEIELDEPKPEQPPPDQPAPTAGGEDKGICELDPSACPKGIDLGAEAKKKVKADVYSVEQIYALRRGRFEVQPYFGFSLNDQFVSHPGPGLALNYYISHVLAVGINGNLYSGLNGESQFNFEHRRATRVAVPLNEYSWSAAFNFTYVPVYGKFAGFSSFIFSYDIYAVGGVGAISTRPIPVIDPDNRKFDFEPKIAFNLGLGFRVFVNRWLAVSLELRDYIFPEKLENLTVAPGPVLPPPPSGQDANAYWNRVDPGKQSPSNPATWTQDGVSVTNHVAAQIGISVFLPFNVNYKLVK